MVTLVIGGSGSGKSAYAEGLLDDFNGVKYYLATMQVYDPEGQQKVEKHRKNREGKNFRTIEQPRDVDKALNVILPGNALLLECMSNLAANEMFVQESQRSAEEVSRKVLTEVKALIAGLEECVIVSNNVFEDGIEYDASTMEYLKALGLINQGLAELADQVVEVVVGIPVMVK